MNKLKLKLSKTKATALSNAYHDILEMTEPDDDHSRLLYEIAQELYTRMSRQLQNPQQKYTLTLTSSEAMAFMQFWQMVPVARASVEFVAMQEVITEIDKASKQPKMIAHEHV